MGTADEFKGDPSGNSPFVGIDNAALGDGASDSLPADTWAQNRIAGNTMFLAREAREIGFVPVIDNAGTPGTLTGIRVYGAFTRFVSIGYWHIPEGKKLESVEISGAANIQSWGTNSNLGDVILRADLGKNTSGSSTVANTNGNWRPFHVTVDYDISQTPGGVIPLRLYVRGEDAEARTGTQLSQNTLGKVIPLNVTTGLPDTSSTFYTEDNGSHPNANALNNQYLQVTAGAYQASADDPVENMDMLGRVEFDESGSGDGQVVIPEGYISAPGGITIQRRYMAVIQIRGLTIKINYRADSVAEIPQSAILAKKPFNSAPALLHLRAVRDLYERRRVLAFGPVGIQDTAIEEFNGRDIPYRWPFAKGDEVSAVTLLERSIKPVAQNSTIRVVMSAIAVQHKSHSNKDLEGLVGSSTWTLALTADQLDDQASAAASWSTDTTSLGSQSVDFDMALIPTDWSLDSPLLKTLHIADLYDPLKDLNFAHYEGSVFDGDNQEIQTIGMKLDLSSYSAESRVSNPIRLKLTCALNGTPDYVPTGYESTAQVRFVLIGFTVIEEASA